MVNLNMAFMTSFTITKSNPYLQKLVIIFLLIISEQSLGQKQIDYKYLNLDSCDFQLVQVGFKNELKGKLNKWGYHYSIRQKPKISRDYDILKFNYYVIDQNRAEWWNTNFKENLNSGDTTCPCEWDFENQEKIFFSHCVAVFHLDTLNHIVSFKKFRHHGFQLYEAPKTRAFKIIALNEKELILLDISGSEARHYRFKRRRIK
ncbi:hypothetical protein KFE94_11805 [bacterium SCSIO 12643]|nr:hypothetical protein KFE94_11805 [bacterium SCSIO 12643]